jgi:hypothetical protein
MHAHWTGLGGTDTNKNLEFTESYQNYAWRCWPEMKKMSVTLFAKYSRIFWRNIAKSRFCTMFYFYENFREIVRRVLFSRKISRKTPRSYYFRKNFCTSIFVKIIMQKFSQKWKICQNQKSHVIKIFSQKFSHWTGLGDRCYEIEKGLEGSSKMNICTLYRALSWPYTYQRKYVHIKKAKTSDNGKKSAYKTIGEGANIYEKIWKIKCTVLILWGQRFKT